MVLVLAFPLLEDLQEPAGGLELVVGIKPHPRHMDVAQFACDKVLHRIHVFFVVVGNTSRCS